MKAIIPESLPVSTRHHVAHSILRAAALPTAAPTPATESTEQVFLDVSIGKRPARRMSFRLFDEEVPKTAKNFRALCEGFTPTGEKKSIGYRDSTFHRLIKGFMLQGGDFTKHNGTGGRSIYGTTFADEKFTKKHDKRGLLSMANSGPNTNGSQFFITFKPTPWLDKRHVVFGELTEGMDVLNDLEAVKTNSADKPLEKLTVVDCGVVKPPPVKPSTEAQIQTAAEAAPTQEAPDAVDKKAPEVEVAPETKSATAGAVPVAAAN